MSKTISKITLEWQEGNQNKSCTISSAQQTKVPGIIRIGRDPAQCDIMIQDPTNKVSRLHAEIIFNANNNSFYIRNATINQGQPNIILVNEKPIQEEEILVSHSQIKLRDFPILISSVEVQSSTTLLTKKENNQANQRINNTNSTRLVANYQHHQYIHQNELNHSVINYQNPQVVNQEVNYNQQYENQQVSPNNINTINTGEIKLNQSLLQTASQDNFDAISVMFRQFIPEDEKIHFARYLGIQGIWGFGTRQFACVTDRRVADITVGRFGNITYQDGYLEHIHSGVIYQPSKFWIYFLIGIYLIVALSYSLQFINALLFTIGDFNIFILLSSVISLFFSLGFFFIFLLTIVRWYYRIVKSGLVLTVAEGEPLLTPMGTYAFTQRLLYIFTNRQLLTRANGLYRCFIIQREARLDIVKKYPLGNL
ncbi:FHA domain-containing protein [Calothrix sp. UHCC 0171]|uniref:FHA domain-containing protein n=1 Tax=Calothrix sp. UHCC 0171 TaxID=3110245 RepID=UPI002B202F59|nr:FHA domain-containing protein [Calothrix sp. UHCC 0171]MEA5570568.1 FHA domain-containing protein [Calothrix sp. UHCC 0171]